MNPRLNSTTYSKKAVDAAMLVLRVGFGITMAPHGYDKLMGFAQKKAEFMNFLGLGGPLSLSLTIFAELFCSVLLIVGLFTRLATIPLIITALVIVFLAHSGDIFGEAADGFFYLLAYIAILLVGPGAFSVDAQLGNKPKRGRFAQR